MLGSGLILASSLSRRRDVS
ncbi:hypothetical protein CSB45_14925 [candidate division KSB3 bacterium]|uniref:Uncharacterized protein n=1 Tax=candidate division KSB3 bacterium TaxID=2044937 RepID=A0A2G6E0T7_9BACT|nr:MAG: hypothetical protein CSB45_14925 [candidate division KSB3 bacterium]